jgi:hypothetical protein
MGQRRNFKCGSLMSLGKFIEMLRRNVGDGVTGDKMTRHWQMQVFVKSLRVW